MVSTDLIFENYDRFLHEHRDDIGSAANAIEMLTSDGSFAAYIHALTEGLSPEARKVAMNVCQRERQMLLEESAQIGPMASMVAYAVTYFPILVDIYAEPILSQVTTVFPTSKPVLSIPRLRGHGKVLNPDGSYSEYFMPTNTAVVRGDLTNVQLVPNQDNNLFALVSGYPTIVNPNVCRINKRFFSIVKIQTTTPTPATINTPVLILADARGQISKEFSFVDGANTITGKIIGHIDWDTGIVTYSVTYSAAGYTCNNITATVRYSPTTGDVGRVKVSLQSYVYDIEVDTREDFEIELQTEMIQEYKDVYNVDLIRTMSEMIKNQIMHNKDSDIAHFLTMYESEMAANGNTATADMNQFLMPAGDFHPANVIDVAKGVIPYINSVTRKIYKSFRAAPQYIVAGLKTASLLDTLQEYVTNINDVAKGGEFGYRTGDIGFRKQTVVSCMYIPDNKIYLVYKAPNDSLQYSSIVDIVYKPLYIVEEITNSMKRSYVKSRSAVEIVSTNALGCVTVQNLPDWYD